MSLEGEEGRNVRHATAPDRSDDFLLRASASARQGKSCDYEIRPRSKDRLPGGIVPSQVFHLQHSNNPANNAPWRLFFKKQQNSLYRLALRQLIGLTIDYNQPARNPLESSPTQVSSFRSPALTFPSLHHSITPPLQSSPTQVSGFKSQPSNLRSHAPPTPTTLQMLGDRPGGSDEAFGGHAGSPGERDSVDGGGRSLCDGRQRSG